MTLRDEQALALFLERLATDFRFFLLQIFNDRALNRPGRHPITELEYDIADWVAGVGAPKTRGVLAPRGFGKTHFVMCLGLWRLFQDPDHKVLIVSKSETHAKKVIATMRAWIGAVWFLQHLVPREGQTDAATQFQVGPAADSIQRSVTALGIGGMLEGNRAHTIIPDDVETDKNTVTQQAREDLDERVKEFKDILYPDVLDAAGNAVKRCEIVYVGTYHHEDSLYLKLADRGYAMRTWPIVYLAPGEKALGLAPLVAERQARDPSLVGRPVFPHRFSAANVLEKRAEGYTRFAMQHLLLCNLKSQNRYPLRLGDLIVMNVDPRVAPIYVAWGERDHSGPTDVEDVPAMGIQGERLRRPYAIDRTVQPYTGTKAFVDPAGRGADETAVAVVGHLSGLFHVKGVAGFPGGAGPEELDRVALFLRRHRAQQAYYESNIDSLDTYGPALLLAVKRRWLEPGQDPEYPEGWKCSVSPVRSSGQKEVRIIETLEPVVSTHRLVVDKAVLMPQDGLEQEYQFQYQFSRLTRERRCLPHDDRVDALAGAVRLWLAEAQIDPETSAARKRAKLAEAEARRRAKKAWWTERPKGWLTPT